MLLPILLLGGCDESTKNEEARKSQEAADSIKFSRNAERENIVKRLELTSNPSLTGFVVLLSEAGTPVAYHGIMGKITSSGKRLTKTVDINGHPTASDEGTFGSSDTYIYFWTTEGQYIQWNGKYLYSDKPIRLRQEPLIINVK